MSADGNVKIINKQDYVSTESLSTVNTLGTATLITSHPID